MTTTVEIFGQDLKNYVTSSKSCKFDNGCVLESRYGNVVFDFNAFPNITSCIIISKKKSGNGKILIKHDGTVSKRSIVSRTKQNIDLTLSNSQIEILRDDLGTGEVQIYGIILNINSNQNEQVVPALEEKPWASIMRRCGKYSRIVLTGNKLMASEGAKLFDKERVVSVETNPPNLCKEDKSGFIFLQSCEVADIKLSEYALNDSLDSKEIYPSLEAPKPINNPNYMDLLKSQAKPSNVLIFDSDQNNITNASSKNVTTTSNNKNLIIDKGGHIVIPVAKLEANTKYVVAIDGNKLKGNGKLEICIMRGNLMISSEIVIFNEMFQQRKVTVSTADATEDGFSLRIQRPENATGTINMKKISVVQAGNSPIFVPISLGKMLTTAGQFEIIENDMEKVHGVYEMPKNENIKFVVIIPSYKNSAWVERNLESVYSQKSDNYRVLFVDDCSPDDTFAKAEKFVQTKSQQERTTLIKNTNRKGALCNIYEGIHNSDDNEIAITLDGDDWFANDSVITKLTEVYSNPYVWLTYGQYRSHPDNGAGCSMQVPTHITNHNLFRQHRWCTSHLRTFYSWLFKKIRKEDLLDSKGDFYPMAWDLSLMMPMLEMGGAHCMFIPDVLYIYNVANPINDSKVNLKLQQSLEREIRARSKYDRI